MTPDERLKEEAEEDRDRHAQAEYRLRLQSAVLDAHQREMSLLAPWGCKLPEGGYELAVDRLVDKCAEYAAKSGYTAEEFMARIIHEWLWLPRFAEYLPKPTAEQLAREAEVEQDFAWFFTGKADDETTE